MPLQNRIHPSGEIFAVPERGTILGNRGGKIHRNDKTLTKRIWATHHWIICELHFKDMHHEPMGQGYTSLFFLDEVTALAAGHRPCFFCRRKEAKHFVELSGMSTDALDRQLHKERTSLPKRSAAMENLLPDSTMIDLIGQPYAIRGSHLLRWTFGGYTEAIPRNTVVHANLLTPPTILRILRSGYQPRWHATALKWGTT